MSAPDPRAITGPDADPTAQVHLGVFYAGVGPQTIWSHPGAAEQMSIDTFVDLARLLERGLFDAFFLGEGLRVRENRGRVHALDVAGRPDAITVLSAIAGATDRIGLVATQNATYNEPADLARRLASLDLVSEGRAGWNVVTTDNAWTGENFRHGGWLPHERRYERAAEFVAAAKDLWAAWADARIAGSGDNPSWLSPPQVPPVHRDTDLVRFTARPTLPASAQGRPVIFQAGDSAGGRDLAARLADVVFSANTGYEQAVAYAADLTTRLAGYGRSRDSLRILPGAQVVLGDSAADARDKADWVRREQVTGPRAIAFLEQYWGRDLSVFDPDGPLPDIEPVDAELDPSRGTLAIDQRTGKLAQIDRWRAQAAEQGLSIRELALQAVPGHHVFVGTADAVADTWVRYVRTRAVDGFNILPHLVPDQLTEIVDRLVPALQERDAYRLAYAGTTLREHLNLPPVAVSEKNDHEAVDAR